MNTRLILPTGFIILLIFCTLLVVMKQQTKAGQNTQTLPSAEVTMDDGTVYEVSNLLLMENNWSGSFYQVYSSFLVPYVPLLYGHAVVLKFPFNEVQQIVVIHKPNEIERVRLTTTAGIELEGYLSEQRQGLDHDVLAITGKTTVEKYASTFELYISKVDKITFSPNEPHGPLVEVKHKDGSVTQNVKDVKFLVDGNDERQKYHEVKDLQLSIGSSTLHVPLIDIKSITIEESRGTDNAVFVLRTGKILRGEISGWFKLCGKTTSLGKTNIDFDAGMNSIKSIVFR